MTNVEIPNSLPMLSVGSHERGSGRACIMNAISYLKGDSDITDYPDCVHPFLARSAQYLNDSVCGHDVVDDRGEGVLCSSCAHRVWLFGARVMGTGRQELGERLGWDVVANREAKWVLAFMEHVKRVFEVGHIFVSNGSIDDVMLSQIVGFAFTRINVDGSQGEEQDYFALMHTLVDLYDEIVDPLPRETVDWPEGTYETVTTEGKIPTYTK